MKFKGKINEILSQLSASLPAFKLDKVYVCEIKLYRETRSLNANKYFHVLCDKLRQKLGISMAHCKNELITSYGKINYIRNGDNMEAVTVTTNIPPEFIRERAYSHLLLDHVDVDDDGREMYTYIEFRGSHTYDTKEMSELIDGTIMECQQQGIETATPNELSRMMSLWEAEREKEK